MNPPILQRWYDKGYALINVLGEGKRRKFNLKCPKGHDVGVWRSNLVSIGCPECDKGHRHAIYESRIATKFRESGWVEVAFVGEKVELACSEGHKATRTPHRNGACFVCVKNKKFTDDLKEVIAIIEKNGFVCMSSKRRNPICMSWVVIQCPNKLHTNTWSFSEVRTGITGDFCRRCNP